MAITSSVENATMSGGEAMLRAAAANGVTTAFGLPGAQIYPLFEAMNTIPNFELIVPRHEQGAAYMAFGYAQSTGKPGTFIVVPGPGVLNASAALCTAAGCNAPVLCLTGNIMSAYLGKGRGHLHELTDQVATLKTLIKDAIHISDSATTSSAVNQAFTNMLSGRPGPVSVEMCWDTMAEPQPISIMPGIAAITPPPIDADAITAAAKLIKSAKHPMIMVGGGARHAQAQVQELAELLGAPVTSFRAGRGIVAEDHELGMSCTAARQLWDETDVLIGIGSRLELQYMRWGSMQHYQPKPDTGPALIRIDIDPTEMQRLQPEVAIVADARGATTALTSAVTDLGFTRGSIDRITLAKDQAHASIREIQPQLDYLDVIRDVLPRDGFFVEELCQVGFASTYGFPVYEPRTYITPGYQGTLGFGFPTALGVKVGNPDRAVVSINGDGGFLFGVGELATAAQFNIGLITLVFNNSSYGNVRRDQLTRFNRATGSDLVNPDIVKLAESFGVAGYRVDSPQALRGTLERAIDNDQPAVIEITIERDSEASPWKYIMG